MSKTDADLYVVLGLCVGHDSLFMRYASRYSDAPVTVLAVKDRVTGNNPCAAIYGAEGYKLAIGRMRNTEKEDI